MLRSEADKRRYAKVFGILQQNNQRDFIQRILDPQNADALVNEDGSLSTHRMATAEAEGTHYVYPMVLKDDFGKLIRFDDPKEAFRHAIKRGDAVGFKTAKEADWFERNWKVVWGHHAPRKDNAKERR